MGGVTSCDAADDDAAISSPYPTESLIQEALRWEEECLVLQRRLHHSEAQKAALQEIIHSQLLELEWLRKECACRFGYQVHVPKQPEPVICSPPECLPDICFDR